MLSGVIAPGSFRGDVDGGNDQRGSPRTYSAPDLSRLLRAVDSIYEQKRATVLRLAGGVRQDLGNIPAVGSPEKATL